MLKSSSQSLDRKNDLSETIVDAAERLLRSYGYQKMTMTDLAAEAGIGVGTTYLHFASKSDVAVAVAERHHAAILAELTKLSHSDASPAEKLPTMLWFRVKTPYEMIKERLSTVSWQQLSRQGMEFINDVHTSSPTRIQIWKDSEAAVYANVIADGIASNDFVPVEPMETAKTMLTALCGFTPKHLEQLDFNDSQTFENKVKGVIRLLVSGISSSHRTITFTTSKSK